MSEFWHEKYIGIPFQEKGRHDVDKGLDCYGLVRFVLDKEHSIRLPSFVQDYSSTNEGKTIERKLLTEATNWLDVPRNTEQEFDVAIMRGIYRTNGSIQAANLHVGLIAYRGALLHVEQGAETVLEMYFKNRMLSDRIISIHRHPELA